MDIYEIRTALHSGKSIYDLPLRVTYYARVSTDKDEQRHSLTAQVRYYTEYIQRNPQWVFVEGYVDEGISGTTVGKRENFLKMVQDAEAGQFDFILTKEISRFSRNTLDSIKYTQDLLRFGVGVLFESDNINTLMPDAELRLTIMSSIAQDEVRKISERVKFGFKRAIEHGVVLGNNKIWGYEKRDGRLVIQEEEAEVVRTIFNLYANERLGIRGIAQQLASMGYQNTRGNEFSFSTIRGILSNPKYKGYYCGRKSSKLDYRTKDIKVFDPEDWVLYKDESGQVVPALVSEELWDKANRILEKRSVKQGEDGKTSYQNRYPYSGKIICGVHKQPYYRSLYRYKSGDKEVWQCREYSRKGRTGCSSPVLYTSELDAIMRQVLEELSLNKAEIIHDLLHLYTSIGNGNNVEEEIGRCKGNIEAILKRKDKLLDLSIDGKIADDEFAQRNGRFNDEIRRLRQRLDTLEQERSKNREMLQSIDTLRQAITQDLDFTDGFSIGVIDSLLDRMEVHPQDGEKKSEIHVSVYLNVISEQEQFTIRRGRGKTSVCTRQHT